ncbi:MAG: ABC transporter permease subunit [Phycisphaerae bacterium]
MGRFILRRLFNAVLTIFGVMLLTFLLFRVVAGDVSANYVNIKAGREQRIEFFERHKLDLPPLINVHRQLALVDMTKPSDQEGADTGVLSIEDVQGSQAAEVLWLRLKPIEDRQEFPTIVGSYVAGLDRETPISDMVETREVVDPVTGHSVDRPRPLVSKTALAVLTKEKAAAEAEPEAGPTTQTATAPATQPAGTETTAPAATEPATRNSEQPTTTVTTVTAPAEATDEPGIAPGPHMVLTLVDGTRLAIDVAALEGGTAGDLLDAVNNHPKNDGKLRAGFTEYDAPEQLLNSQFFWHLRESVTFSGESYRLNKTIWEIIVERAPYSLSITVPALALGWLTAMIVSSIVAYFRGTWIDHLGVFLSVLGMCIPFLAYMILGQAIMFRIRPEMAYGMTPRVNIYVPIAISVIAGLGASVRFYRTIILDQVNQDYVRTARAKGVALPSILFKHVLKNCMLPILTNLVMAIPFLIMGSLLLEKFYGIPGLGDLLLTSIYDRDVPMVTGLTFLTAVLYVLGLLLTDLLYSVFDPRVRLR